MTNQCENVRQEYASIKTLKAEFDLALETATTGATTPEQAKQALERAKALKALLEQKRDALSEMLLPFSKEGFPYTELKQQYETQKEIFQRVGILEKLSNGELGIKGIDNQEYAYPTLSAISERMRINKETLKTKLEQGFIELQITPIAQSLDKKIDTYRQVLWKHYKERKLFTTLDNPEDTPRFPDDLPFIGETINKIKSGELQYENIWKVYGKYDEEGDFYNDANRALSVEKTYRNADTKGNLVYYPKEFDEANHQGKTKLQLIEETKTTAFPGYIVTLREKLPYIPRGLREDTNGNVIDWGRGELKGGRKQIAAGGRPKNYLKRLQNDPQYKHEIGETPDDHIIHDILYLEKYNQIKNDPQGKGSASYQLGGYLSFEDQIPCACWDSIFLRFMLYKKKVSVDPHFRAGACSLIRVL